MPRLLLLVTEDWYFRSHRLDLARAALAAGYEVSIGTHLNGDPQWMCDEGFTVHPLPFSRRLDPLGDLVTLRAVRSLCRQLRPDLVHLVAQKPALIGGLALVGASSLPVLTAFAGLGYVFTSDDRRARWLRPLLVTVLRRLLAGPARWVLVQNADDDQLLAKLALGNPGRRRIVGGSGIDTERFAPTPLPRAAGHAQVTVLYAGRLLRDKGLYALVAAARRLRVSHPQIRIRLAGDCDGDNPSAIAASEVRGWVAEGLVEWLGRRDDMPSVYADSDIVCLPSRREGLPKSLLEGAACARPLVASDVPGCREVCRHNDTGLLVPPDDAVALAGAIAALCDDPLRAERYGRNARAHVMAHYAVSVVTQQMLELYAEIRGHVESSLPAGPTL